MIEIIRRKIIRRKITLQREEFAHKVRKPRFILLKNMGWPAQRKACGTLPYDVVH